MKNIRKSKFKIIIAVLAVIVFFTGAAAYLVFWNKTPDIAENQSFNLIDNLRTLQVNGGTLELTEDELNSTFKTLFDKPMEKSGIVVNGAYVNIETNSITLFAPIKYRGMSLLPNITGSVSFENDRLIFNVNSVKIGKLSIPKNILMNKLKAYSSTDIIIDGDKIEISKFLLPFNAKDIYLKDNKVFAEIVKIGLPHSSDSNTNETTTNTNVSSTSSGNSASNNQSKPSQQAGQNSCGTTSSNSSTNVNTQTSTTPPVTPPANQVAALNKVSGQLNGVIADVQTEQEKQMMKKIQTVVNGVASDPNYPYQSEANEVKAWYQTLQPEAKIRVKNAILRNVNVMDILKLINIFGV